jgi:hypothetical protein
MTDDPNEYVAEQFPILVAKAQESELAMFEEAHVREREQLAELRRQSDDLGMTATELLRSMTDDGSEKALARLEVDTQRMQQEANEAAAAKEQTDDLPQDRFPAPPLVGPTGG